MKSLVLVAAAIVTTACLLAPSTGAAFGKNKVQYRQFAWSILRSEHFDLYYYTEEEFLAERAAKLADAAYDSLSRTFGHEMKARVPIIIYRSQNEFQETNVTLELLGEGTGGFTEMFKNRVVLPFTGSYEDLRHVMVHELTHVFSFDMMYGGLLESIFTRQYLFTLPLWFLEGMTEYESQRWDAEAEMVMRDAALNGYYFPLYQDIQGYLAYKQGQSVIRYIIEKYGKEKLTDIIQATSTSRNIDKALQLSIGVDSEGLTKAWVEYLKKEYWPEIAVRTDPDELATRLTDHRKDDSFTNIMPAVSPDGQKIVFLSDRSGYDDLYLMSALDGKILRRLVKGQRSQDFESFHSLRSAISWSPDGKHVAFVSKRKDRDVINIVEAQSGKRSKRISPNFDSIFYPAFSPDGRALAFVGANDGRPGVFVLNLDDEDIEAVTMGALEYSGPAWSPDGKSVAFSCIAPGKLDSLDIFTRMGPLNRPDRDVYLARIEDGSLERVTSCSSEDVSPVWAPDGNKMLFVSDRNGGYNLFAYDFADSTTTQLTDVLGGIFNPSWSAKGDRLAYSCFNAAGWDVFGLKDPLANLEPIKVLPESSWKSEAPWLPRQEFAAAEGPPDSLSVPASAGPGDRPETDAAADTPGTPAAPTDSTMQLRPTRDLGTLAVLEGPDIAPGRSDTVQLWPPPEDVQEQPPPHHGIPRDSTLARTSSGYETERYKLHFTPDWVVGAFQYSSAFGFGGMTAFSASDVLGNHQIYVASDIFSDLDESDALVVYNYLPRRFDYSAGIFHFKNYYYSDRTTLGTPIGEGDQEKLFSERNYGGVVAVSMPIDVFRRFEADFTAMRIDREIFAEGSEFLDEPIVLERTRENLFIPRLAYIKDTTIWGPFGPAGGSRYELSVERSLVDLFSSDLSFTTVTGDFRKYFRLTSRTQFATRFVGATSQGSQPLAFFLGGPYSLRGYDYFEFAGNNIILANAELRFPFVESLILRGPLPISLGGIRGVFFFDIGGAWNGDLDNFRAVHTRDDHQELDDLAADYGFGMRMGIAYFLLRLDFAWATRFSGGTGKQVYFSLGQDF